MFVYLDSDCGAEFDNEKFQGKKNKRKKIKGQNLSFLRKCKRQIVNNRCKLTVPELVHIISLLLLMSDISSTCYKTD